VSIDLAGGFPVGDRHPGPPKRAFSHSLGGFRSFVGTAANGEVAPIAAISLSVMDLRLFAAPGTPGSQLLCTYLYGAEG
jgi:hypothetical protein